MNTEWLQYTVIRAASLLAPGDQRAEWVKEWCSELWYIPRRRAMLFSLGAFRDALWLRRNSMSPVARARIYLKSPFSCLAFLSILAAVSTFIAIRLLAPALEPSWPLSVRNLPGACIRMLLPSRSVSARNTGGVAAACQSPSNILAEQTAPWNLSRAEDSARATPDPLWIDSSDPDGAVWGIFDPGVLRGIHPCLCAG